MPAKKSSSKPSYLGLLNAIAVGEAAAEPLFDAWAARTPDPKLAETLRFVGMREGEHAKAFAKRMLELGYEVRGPAANEAADAALAIAGSRRSDLRKFNELGFDKPAGDTDVFDAMFADKTIDPQTGALLGRYIAEERDSVRRLRAEYTRLHRADQRRKSAKKTAKRAAKATKAAGGTSAPPT